MAEIGAGSGSSYPGSLDTNSTLEVDFPSASKTLIRAATPNDLAAGMVNVQTELGTDPAGTLTDVKTYLQTEHETNGTHKASLVAMIAGTQTVTGAKTFSAAATFSANPKISGLAPGLFLSETDVVDKNVLIVLDASSFQIQERDDLDAFVATRVGWDLVTGSMTSGKVPLARIDGYTGSVVHDFPSIIAGGTSTVDITVTGAALGDFVLLSQSSALEFNIIFRSYVEAANTVRVAASNHTGSAVDPASRTYYVKVIKKDF